MEQKGLYPLLASLAIDTLFIPGSSASVELEFSTVGEAAIGKWNRLAHKNLEWEILIRKNKE